MKQPLLWRIVAVMFTMTLIASGCGDDSEGDDQTPNEDSSVSDVSLLDTVKERGTLKCGVSGSAAAFSETQPDGTTTGFDADFCRVVAAAILGDATKVEFVPLTAEQRFTEVKSGKVDLLMRNTTWTQSRDAEIGMDFGPTTYYDGQQLLARESDGFSSNSQVVDIVDAKVCTNAGTTTEKNITDAASANGIQIELLTFPDFDIIFDNFINGSCDVVTTDGSALVAHKYKKQPEDQQWVIFPGEPLSKEPLGPVYRQNDSEFADAVNWAVYATIIADEKGITQNNVDDMLANPSDAEVGRLLGGEGQLQEGLGLSADAFYQVISQVGNYDEIFSRNLGPTGLSRDGTVNAGWENGGLIYAPPSR